MAWNKPSCTLAVSAIFLLCAALCSSQEGSGSQDIGRSLGFVHPSPKNHSDLDESVLDKSAKHFLTTAITTAVTPALYIIVFAFGLLANGLAMINLITKVQRVPSTIFLMNLAAADLLLILVLPFKIHYHLQGNNWLFGEALCRTMTAFFYGNMYCSILLLTFISIDRYFALVHPFFSKRFRDNRFAVAACSMIWLLVGLSVLPFLLQRQVYSFQDPDITTCHDVLPRTMQQNYFFYYFVCLVVLGFLIPCLITIFCYVSVIKTLMMKNAKYAKAIRTIILVLIVYLVCFTPSNTILLIHFSQYHLAENNHLYLYYVICLVLSTFNSCIDPFIYYYMSDDFRDNMRSIIFFSKEKKSEDSRKTFLHTDSTSTSKIIASKWECSNWKNSERFGSKEIIGSNREFKEK
ncbi:proteinase-activated receptor 3-like [Pristis pectinata]|uniref:proteinase-activated receptor 3-like n=1 Tax=Pristis pectinata TaxID=685728 RepID=UPI00223DAD1B|nr:proteinase-activated receptor 3-like [Pristis pectinata]